MSARITTVAAEDGYAQAVIRNLWQHYCMEFSAALGFPPDHLGRFSEAGLRDVFSSDPRALAWLISQPVHRPVPRLAPVGFVFTREDPEGWREIEQFYILPHARRCRLGTRVAHRLFEQFPGRWRVFVQQGMTGSERFWEASLAPFEVESWSGIKHATQGSWRRLDTTGFVAPVSEEVKVARAFLGRGPELAMPGALTPHPSALLRD